MSFDYDLFVIGAGPGGAAAAKRAATYGARVAVAEQASIGGTCINRGCIPKKLIVYAADFALQDRVANSYGWSDCRRQIDWSRLMSAVHQHIESIHQSYRQAFQKAGIELIRGHASFVDPHTVQLDGRKLTKSTQLLEEASRRTLTADKILIAVGGHPIKPDVPGMEYAITSDDMFHLAQLPKRLVIIGGGYIGVEFSSMMNAFGVQVTLLDTNELVLERFDRDVRSAVQSGLSQRGVRFLNKTTAKEIKPVASGGLQMTLSGDSQETLTADVILCATSRAPNTQSLGLETAGVEVGKKGAIQVDEYSRTSQDHIFAVGDCTSRVPLTPVARAEGRAVAETAFGNQPQKVDYDYVTSAVFARPEAATVGMTEEQAREKLGTSQVQCHHTEFKPLLYRLMEQSEPALMKLVVDGNSDQVLGAHMVGEHAADIIQSLAVAIRNGATKQDLDATIGIHPTTGEEFLLME
ncbi:MAG: glutathione-disulfide reductase [Chroococcidiopsidaceae cyanobacterium CP_BM_ER_R8_30]|nr:glutathione-disulfide reductase [Chroococcidiopsidaceae cyanobacterium CP_BM_ER_R8_30]